MWLYYLPILTTLFCIYFASSLFSHYSGKGNSTHILWWGFGVTAFGLGTLIESLITIFGWSDPLFRSWYIAGALMGGAPLAQGTVYLMLKRRTAHILSVILVSAILFGSTMVILTPLDYALVKSHVPQGDVIIWSWIRLISPFINTYAFIFLVGGAILSAVRYRSVADMKHRVKGNTLIAIGAILPGIGGGMSRAGYTEVLYIAEFIGILLIYAGYKACVKSPLFSVKRKAQQSVAAA